jgi:hypothetical protein
VTSPSRAKTSAGGNPGSSVSDVPSCYPGTLEARQCPRTIGVCTENLHPNVVVMKSAKDCV